jgi:hypothetical protein
MPDQDLRDLHTLPPACTPAQPSPEARLVVVALEVEPRRRPSAPRDA